MNRTIFDNFMSRYAIETGNLKIFYSFLNGSGEILFNDLYTTGQHYSGSCLLADRYPGLSVGYGEGPASGVNGYGTFRYADLLRIGYQLSDENWTAFLDFEALNHCGSDEAELAVLMTNKENPTDNGFTLGLNKGNRLVFENYYGGGKVNKILFDEVADAAVVSLSKNNATFELTYHNFPQSTHNSISFELDNYTAGNTWYLGGLFNPTYGYTGLSGYFHEFLYFNAPIDKLTKNAFSKAFFVSGIEAAYITTGTQYIGLISSVNYNPTGLLGTGIIDYETSSVDISQKDGADISLCLLSGVTGYITGEIIEFITGAPTGINSEVFVPANDLYDYSKLLKYSKSNPVYFGAVTTGDIIEIYSFREPNPDINLNLPYDTLYGVFKPANNNASIYFNGLYQESGFDYTVTGTYTFASGFNNLDGTMYDIISGSRTRYEYHNTGLGSLYTINGVAATQDVYLNGQKLISGLNYSGVGTNLFLMDAANLGTGILQFVPRHEDLYQIKTGNIDLASFKFAMDQTWLNGQRLKHGESYIRTNYCTIRGTSDVYENGNVIYDNSDDFWGI